MRRRSARLGQHELKDSSVIQTMVDSALILPSDIVFEIGAGQGNLTRALCERGGRVIAWEIDQNLYERARRNLQGIGNLELRFGDGLSMTENFDVCASSVPYYISRKFVEWLSTKNFRVAVIALQKEFVEKLIAKPSSNNYRMISALAQARFKLEPIIEISPEGFSPPPKVSSVVLKTVPKSRNTITKGTISMLQTIFSNRGKLVSSSIRLLAKKKKLEYESVIEGITDATLSKRVEQMDPMEALRTAQKLLTIVD